MCIEFVAAITWIAEVFSDKAQKEKWLGITQLFRVARRRARDCCELSGFAAPWKRSAAPRDADGTRVPRSRASWRYLLLTGIAPALLIALMLPFVPESKLWKERKTGRHAQAPELRRSVFAGVPSRHARHRRGCPRARIASRSARCSSRPDASRPGLPNLAELSSKALKPLVDRGEET